MAVKHFEEDIVNNQCDFIRAHISFQSTSSCNISTVNALRECHTFTRNRSRGQGENKRKWAIEMNHARSLYLQTYNKVDVLDHYVKNTNMNYRSWKYWHAPMLLAKKMAIAISYDMYLEACEGNNVKSWTIDQKDQMNFFQFRERLSEQMLSWSPSLREYPGDSNMRQATQQNKTRRARISKKTEKGSDYITQRQYEKEIFSDKTKLPRICGDLKGLKKHIESRVYKKNGGACNICGKLAYTKCTICNVHLHFFPLKGDNANKSCFLDFHDENFLGLARKDYKKRSEWKPASKNRINNNMRHIKKLRDKMCSQVHDESD